MNDANNIRVFLKNGIRIVVNTKVNFIILYGFAGYFFYSIQYIFVAAAVIVGRYNIKTML